MANVAHLNHEHRAIMEQFGYPTMAYESDNPEYIEIYVQCNIIQFQEALRRLDYKPIGIAMHTMRGEDWLTTWVKPHGSK